VKYLIFGRQNIHKKPKLVQRDFMLNMRKTTNLLIIDSSVFVDTDQKRFLVNFTLWPLKIPSVNLAKNQLATDLEIASTGALFLHKLAY
jgi:hypothetical protein